MKRSRGLAACLVVSAMLGAWACTTTEKKAAAPAVDAPRVTDTTPRDYAGIHNVVAFHEGFYSGSVPEGDEGFRTLAAMGVRTIISVDGAPPDVERARAHGLRYIHLPIGYNGFDEQRRLELARAGRDSLREGPVYIHCHHGKHRSAGAAAAVAATLGWATPEEMVERMKVSGTAPSYQGLYACAANARVVPAAELERVPADFPEVSPPSTFVKGMVEMDEVMEHLKAIEKAGWRVPQDHPDLVPVAEAGRLENLLRVHAEGERARSKPPEFAAGMLESAALAQRLEDWLGAGDKSPEELSSQLRLIGASCKDCHVKWRD
jgi:protein tyrosine phosphatase (PTP) superfamily phosphohydrolase (DUF442 family)